MNFTTTSQPVSPRSSLDFPPGTSHPAVSNLCNPMNLKAGDFEHFEALFSNNGPHTHELVITLDKIKAMPPHQRACLPLLDNAREEYTKLVFDAVTAVLNPQNEMADSDDPDEVKAQAFITLMNLRIDEDVSPDFQKDISDQITVLNGQGAFRNLQLQDKDISDFDLSDLDLEGSDLTDADVQNTDLSNTNLENTTLTGTLLYGADLTNAGTYGANLSDAHYDETTDLSGVITKDTIQKLFNKLSKHDYDESIPLCDEFKMALSADNADTAQHSSAIQELRDFQYQSIALLPIWPEASEEYTEIFIDAMCVELDHYALDACGPYKAAQAQIRSDLETDYEYMCSSQEGVRIKHEVSKQVICEWEQLSAQYSNVPAHHFLKSVNSTGIEKEVRSRIAKN